MARALAGGPVQVHIMQADAIVLGHSDQIQHATGAAGPADVLEHGWIRLACYSKATAWLT